MPRKVKPQSNKAIQRTVTLPRAYEEYLAGKGRISSYIQDLIAKDITGFSHSEFVSSFYNSHAAVTSRHHSQDSLQQEHKRAAKWILESRVDWAEYSIESNEVILQVKWLASNTYSKLIIDLNTDGFVHVIYDRAVNSHPSVISKGTYFDVEDYINWYLDEDNLCNSSSVYPETNLDENLHTTLALTCDSCFREELSAELFLCVDTFSKVTTSTKSKIKLLVNWIRNQQMGCGVEVV